MAEWMMMLSLFGPVSASLVQRAMLEQANIKVQCRYTRENLARIDEAFELTLAPDSSAALTKWEVLPGNFIGEEHRRRQCARKPRLCDFSAPATCQMTTREVNGKTRMTLICPVIAPEYNNDFGVSAIRDAGRVLIFTLEAEGDGGLQSESPEPLLGAVEEHLTPMPINQLEGDYLAEPIQCEVQSS